jgi:type II secretory pathway component PulF
MANQLRSYSVRYLLDYRVDISAVEDSRIKGQYHHEALMIGESELDIVSQVRRLGGLPISVNVIKKRFRLFNRIGSDYKQQFLKAIYYNSSVMSSAKALESVIEADNSSIRELLNPALMIIKRGGTFMEAIDAIGAFDESTLAILEAGEQMGSLKVSIDAAVRHLSSSALTNKSIIVIINFAIIEIMVALSSVIANRYGLLPSLLNNIPDSASPVVVEQIKSAVASGIFLNDVMIVLSFVCIFACVVAFFAYFDDDKKFRRWVDNKVMLMPALSKVIEHTAVSNSFKVAASLLEGGVHLSLAMKIAVKSSRVPMVMDYWDVAIARSEAGDTVVGSLLQPLLDNAERVLISAHKKSKDLAESFKHVAEKRLDKSRRSAKNFSIILFMGVAVYCSLAMASSLYVMYIQNASLMSETKQ